MSIKSLEEAFETLRTLPHDQQSLACDFIEFLEYKSQTDLPPVLKLATKTTHRRRAAKPRSAVVYKNGLWVHTGTMIGPWRKSLYRDCQMERILRHLKTNRKPQS